MTSYQTTDELGKMEVPKLDLVREDELSMFTDLYELTMCASYFEKGKRDSATFDLFIRKMPSNRSYFVFAGLAQALLFLKSVQFTNIQIDYLARLGFRRDFLDYLRNLKFTGEVCAVPEGTLVFPNECIVRVTAPIIEAQPVETFLSNTVNLQTMLEQKLRE